MNFSFPSNNSSAFGSQSLLGRHWNEILWNLGGVFLYDNSLLAHLSLYQKVFGIQVPPVTVSGGIPCLWSVDWFRKTRNAKIDSLLTTIGSYIRHDVPIFLTFDNPALNEQDLDDRLAHTFLDILIKNTGEKRTGVYVASDILARRLRQQYPGITIKSCVNRAIMEQNRNPDFYNSLAQLYDCVALHPADAANQALLDGLNDRLRFEITVNDTCLDTCPCRREHMLLLGKNRRNPFDLEAIQQIHTCLDAAGCEQLSRPQGACPLLLSKARFETLFDAGFRHFRLQAESLRNELAYAYNLSHWLHTDKAGLSNKQATLYSLLLIDRGAKAPDYPTGLSEYIQRYFD